MSEIVWPAIDGFVYEPSMSYVDVHGILARCEERILASLGAGTKPRNILFNSKHGLGKTLMAATLAKNLRAKLKQSVPMVVFDCSEDTREYHLKGTYNLNEGGSTSFVPGPIPTAIHFANTTGLAILCLEEMSALTPGAQKVLNSITDWRSGIFLPLLGKTIYLEPKANIIVLATMNPNVYGGVYLINQDLRSRFVEEVVHWPAMDAEKKILSAQVPGAAADVVDKVAQFVRDTRGQEGAQLSTREAVSLLQELHELPMRKEEVLYCLLNKFEGRTVRKTIADRLDATFNTTLRQTVDKEVNA